jgi:carbamoyl-phosphate synthase large subunit
MTDAPRSSAVLVTSVGRKSSLVSLLVEAAARVDGDLRVLTSDLDPTAPAHELGHGRVELPPLEVGAPLHADVVRSLSDSGIGMVIPTRDAELEFWAEHLEALNGSNICPVVAPLRTLHIALDKLTFALRGAAAGLPTIPTTETLLDGSDGPLVVKERFGAGSRSIALGVGRLEAAKWAKDLQAPVFQPFLRGEEFSADAWVSRSGAVRGPVVRRRDVVQDGEAAVTTTIRDPELEDMARSVLAWLPARGPVNVQLLRTEDGRVHIVELNARFGGASTCSVRAGLDLWVWELSEHRGLDPEPFRRLAGEVRQTRERLPDGSVTDRIELLGVGP